jgi:transposase-like protein
MPKCPRCHSSMLIDYDASIDGWQRTWKCLGCGREVFENAVKQAEDERLTQMVRKADSRKKAR